MSAQEQLFSLARGAAFISGMSAALVEHGRPGTSSRLCVTSSPIWRTMTRRS
jgi:hypothetical protein